MGTPQGKKVFPKDKTEKVLSATGSGATLRAGLTREDQHRRRSQQFHKRSQDECRPSVTAFGTQPTTPQSKKVFAKGKTGKVFDHGQPDAPKARQKSMFSKKRVEHNGDSLNLFEPVERPALGN